MWEHPRDIRVAEIPFAGIVLVLLGADYRLLQQNPVFGTSVALLTRHSSLIPSPYLQQKLNSSQVNMIMRSNNNYILFSPLQGECCNWINFQFLIGWKLQRKHAPFFMATPNLSTSQSKHFLQTHMFQQVCFLATLSLWLKNIMIVLNFRFKVFFRNIRFEDPWGTSSDFFRKPCLCFLSCLKTKNRRNVNFAELGSKFAKKSTNRKYRGFLELNDFLWASRIHYCLQFGFSFQANSIKGRFMKRGWLDFPFVTLFSVL